MITNKIALFIQASHLLANYTDFNIGEFDPESEIQYSIAHILVKTWLIMDDVEKASTERICSIDLMSSVKETASRLNPDKKSVTNNFIKKIYDLIKDKE